MEMTLDQMEKVMKQINKTDQRICNRIFQTIDKIFCNGYQINAIVIENVDEWGIDISVYLTDDLHIKQGISFFYHAKTSFSKTRLHCSVWNECHHLICRLPKYDKNYKIVFNKLL